MITCNLMGGLGNQLFQIFTTISYAMKTKHEFNFLNVKTLGGTNNTLRHTFWDTLFAKLHPILIENFPEKMVFVKEVRFPFRELHISRFQSPNVCLYGYFQSYKYFQEFFPLIYKILEINKQKRLVFEKTGLTKDELQNTISMHFRLGDYKNIQDFHPIMPYDYYKNALNYILSSRKNKDFRVLFFCEKDDIFDVSNIIALLIKEFPNIEFIKVDDMIDDWQQMLIMSCCRDNIIANSSFSWWGGYFNKNENKIVCYPCQWFGPNLNHDTIDLYPTNWKKIYF